MKSIFTPDFTRGILAAFSLYNIVTLAISLPAHLKLIHISYIPIVFDALELVMFIFIAVLVLFRPSQHTKGIFIVFTLYLIITALLLTSFIFLSHTQMNPISFAALSYNALAAFFAYLYFKTTAIKTAEQDAAANP